MRRRQARPYGHTVPATRLLSLLMGLAVMGMLYQRAIEPQFWRNMLKRQRGGVRGHDRSRQSLYTQIR